MLAREKEKARARAETEFYETAARLYRAGIGLFAVMAVMYAAWARLQAEVEGPPGSPPPLDI
jgi:hypothetical protein